MTLSRTRSARYSIPPNSSSVKVAMSTDLVRSIDFVRSIDLVRSMDFPDRSWLWPRAVLPNTKIDDTAVSMEVALLIFLVSNFLRRMMLFDSVRATLIRSASSSTLCQCAKKWPGNDRVPSESDGMGSPRHCISLVNYNLAVYPYHSPSPSAQEYTVRAPPCVRAE